MRRALQIASHLLALVALVVVTIHGIFLSSDYSAASGALGATTGLALLHLTLGFGRRVGGELPRRGIRAPDPSDDVPRSHPYRTPAELPVPRVVERPRRSGALVRYVALASLAAAAGFSVDLVLFR